MNESDYVSMPARGHCQLLSFRDPSSMANGGWVRVDHSRALCRWTTAANLRRIFPFSRFIDIDDLSLKGWTTPFTRRVNRQRCIVCSFSSLTVIVHLRLGVILFILNRERIISLPCLCTSSSLQRCSSLRSHRETVCTRRASAMISLSRTNFLAEQDD